MTQIWRQTQTSCFCSCLDFQTQMDLEIILEMGTILAHLAVKDVLEIIQTISNFSSNSVKYHFLAQRNIFDKFSLRIFLYSLFYLIFFKIFVFFFLYFCKKFFGVILSYCNKRSIFFCKTQKII